VVDEASMVDLMMAKLLDALPPTALILLGDKDQPARVCAAFAGSEGRGFDAQAADLQRITGQPVPVSEPSRSWVTPVADPQPSLCRRQYRRVSAAHQRR
jgi:hypothetical protein